MLFLCVAKYFSSPLALDLGVVVAAKSLQGIGQMLTNIRLKTGLMSSHDVFEHRAKLVLSLRVLPADLLENRQLETSPSS